MKVIRTQVYNKLVADLEQANNKLSYLTDEMTNSAKFAQDQENEIAELQKQIKDLAEALESIASTTNAGLNLKARATLRKHKEGLEWV